MRRFASQSQRQRQKILVNFSQSALQNSQNDKISAAFLQCNPIFPINFAVFALARRLHCLLVVLRARRVAVRNVGNYVKHQRKVV
jgi:hypothetical protein